MSTYSSLLPGSSWFHSIHTLWCCLCLWKSREKRKLTRALIFLSLFHKKWTPMFSAHAFINLIGKWSPRPNPRVKPHLSHGCPWGMGRNDSWHFRLCTCKLWYDIIYVQKCVKLFTNAQLTFLVSHNPIIRVLLIRNNGFAKMTS